MGQEVAPDILRREPANKVRAIKGNFTGRFRPPRVISLKNQLDESKDLVEPDGIEPTTSCMPCKRSPN